jgi:hypothetical protein
MVEDEGSLTFSDGKDVPIKLEKLYDGQSCFLILSGPSLANHDLTKLKQPGIVTFGVNNSAKVFRPNMWTCVDDPEKFLISIWKDPSIMKFAPIGKYNKKLFDNIKWEETDIPTSSCPNVIYYHRNEHFNAETFLTQTTVNWGNHKKYGGRRSVFMAAIKILYLLGFTRVFLVGCDFKMELDKQNYAWPQDRTNSSVKGNNTTYGEMKSRFTTMRPMFEAANFFIYNCNVTSEFKVFPFIDFDAAVNLALADFPNTLTESAEGMYERKSNNSD